jgi:hypothetical protein
MSDNRERQQNKLVIWAFIGTIAICALSIAGYAYYVMSMRG